MSPSQYAGYLKLFDMDINSKVQETEISEGKEFEVGYIIENREDFDIDISSIELEIEGLELVEVS